MLLPSLNPCSPSLFPYAPMPCALLPLSPSLPPLSPTSGSHADTSISVHYICMFSVCSPLKQHKCKRCRIQTSFSNKECTSIFYIIQKLTIYKIEMSVTFLRKNYQDLKLQIWHIRNYVMQPWWCFQGVIIVIHYIYLKRQSHLGVPYIPYTISAKIPWSSCDCTIKALVT